MMKKIQYRETEQGLSLIELAIALIVIGLLTTAFLQLYSIQQAKQKKELQDYKIFTIADGLSSYFSEHGHYACPGRRDKSTTDQNFGDTTAVLADLDSDGTADELACNNTAVADDDCAADGSYCVALGPDGSTRVRIGSIPYKEIGIGKEDIIDVYGNQFTYAVVEEQASESLYQQDTPITPCPTCRQIVVNDFDVTTRHPDTDIPTAGNTITKNVEFVFFSHGEDGAGSYTSYGSLNPNLCASADIDQENCDEDSIFSTALFANRLDGATGFYDDDFVDDPLSWVYIWDNVPDDAKSIYNRSSGNMGVGLNKSDIALEKVHVVGNLRVEAPVVAGTPDLNEGGKIQTTQICNESQTDCFYPAVIGGDQPTVTEEDGTVVERFDCGDGQILVGMDNSTPRCRSIVLDSSGSCPALEYATGVTLNPTTGAISLNCAPVP